MSLQLSDYVVKTAVNGFATSGQPAMWSGAKVLLLSGMPASPSSATPLSSFTGNEANYSGYARGTIGSYFAVAFQDAGYWALTGSAVQFITTGNPPAVGNNIVGYAVTDSAVANLLGFEQFSTPIPMGAANDNIVITPQVGLPTTPTAAAGVLS